MKFSSFTRNSSLTGIEITEKAINLVEISYCNERYSIEHIIQKELPAACHYTDVLNEILSQIKLRTPDVAIALPYHQTIFRWMELDNTLKDKEILQYITLNAERLFNCPMHELFIDYAHIPIVNEGNKTKLILCVAAKQQHILPMITLLKNSGLTLKKVEVDVLTLQRAVTHFFPETMLPKHTVAIVHISFKNTLIMILHQGLLKFVHSENNPDFYTNKQALSIIQLLQNSIQQCDFLDHASEITTIFLTGIHPTEPIATGVEKNFQIPTRIIHSYPGITIHDPPISHTTASELIVCMGLALRAKE